METIEYRALEHANLFRDLFKTAARASYACGATEQQEIDIQRACNWLDEYFDRCFGVSALEVCEKAKLELTKAMKGE